MADNDQTGLVKATTAAATIGAAIRIPESGNDFADYWLEAG
jgi:hypothetical protein